MIVKSIEIEKFRAFEHVSFDLGKRITVISGRNATQKTTVLGIIGQPFTISSKTHPMYGCKTIDGYNFRSQFREKFKISPQYDVIGEHKWKLYLHKGIYEQDYFSIESIARRQRGYEPTLRFWNAESRAKGAGYIQLPAYFLSLSRLFPIGETGKTQAMAFDLTQDELKYCIANYRTILSIQSMGDNPEIGLEKGTSSKIFAGVSDSVHDIFTNSSGEGNVIKIILAVLSFKRLKEQYGRKYKGGILLIDELDATLYGFSQGKLVEYLWKAAGDYRIQIIFTTHSPLILKCVNKYYRKERQEKGINLPLYAYDNSIVYLEPCYNEEGKRTIMPRNISSTDELSRILNDINLTTY
ncbi:9-O-acetyl-N-acetylneuraminate esterase [Lachnospiraceae bacterium]|nr:9-O-acetyl-N-acetylneuraminate esterase [Lachnospiraceae bacterium]